MDPPEIACMDPENYKKNFSSLYWCDIRRNGSKSQKHKIGKAEKIKRLKAATRFPICNAPTLLGNPSQFAVYSEVRRVILSKWKELYNVSSEISDDSDNDDNVSAYPAVAKLPKITSIGLRSVFALISQARFTEASFCEHALVALHDVLQGHMPEELYQEHSEIISNLHAMLVEIASGSGPNGRAEVATTLTALSSSCLISLSVARGETELILNAVASLIMSQPSLSEQYIQVPCNFITLQRSVQSVTLGIPSRNLWLNYGVPQQSLITTVSVDLPKQLSTIQGDLICRSLASDGCFLYVYTSKGLLKIGSGYSSSVRPHVYLYKPDFFCSDRHGWLGYCKNRLFVRLGRKKTELYEVDKDTFEVKNILRLEPGPQTPVDAKNAVFSDGNQLGVISLTNSDYLSIRMYDIESVTSGDVTSLVSRKELNVHLLQRRTLVLGCAPFEDCIGRRAIDLDAPVAVQLEDNDDDPLTAISAGLDFALLLTESGKVYYIGKGSSLGYKVPSPHYDRWSLMKDTIFNQKDTPNTRKVLQIAVGHEGVHAVFVLDNGTALFSGVSRRGEDGDYSKQRRTLKPSRPKKMIKTEGHYIVAAACNNGSSALITKQGILLMFGKDTLHCDPTGVVTALKHEKIVQVSLGKAHAAALTNHGLVYTFGINNKGQCGREFGYVKEKNNSVRQQNQSTKEDAPLLCPQSQHTWLVSYCRICVVCRECTGFTPSCHCVDFSNRVPGEDCGCGEGDSGCSTCGVCRRCADSADTKKDGEKVDLDDNGHSSRLDSKSGKDGDQNSQLEGRPSSVEGERDSSLKLSCLAPSRVAVPGGHRVTSVSCGLHHTVLLTENGEVLTFGSNQFGQLGAGDISVHHRIIRVRVPRSSGVAAGSNHTVVVTKDGELYTFGSYQKGGLGRPRVEEVSVRADRPWYATPSRVSRLGPRHSSKAVWASASGDQTFVQVSQTLIKTETLFSSTITANGNSIVILPNRAEHTFKCITINKFDGSCNSWTGPEQVDFVNSLTCLDPLYDVLWCYQPQVEAVKCYNILAYNSRKGDKGNSVTTMYRGVNNYEFPNFDNIKRTVQFENIDDADVLYDVDDEEIDNITQANVSILHHELAIPSVAGCKVTRMHAALHLLGCLDFLSHSHDNRWNSDERKRDHKVTNIPPAKEDFVTVNRFESLGGGWGYSGHSIEAIRFMSDTDLLLGGYCVYGGRGDYTARIKLFDIGFEGGEQEGDGELIAESDEFAFECAPREKYSLFFDLPIAISASRWYVAWACINGPSSDCGSSGQAMVINDDIGFHFKTSKKSNNGTDVNAGQIPCLLYNNISQDRQISKRSLDSVEPVVALSNNISRKVTVSCFRSLITLLQWSWNTFKATVLDTISTVPVNYQKLKTMKHQKRLVYVIRASLRLVKSYINEVFPQNTRKRNSIEYMSYFDAIADIRNLIQSILADPVPTCSMLSKKGSRNKSYKVCYVQFAVEITNAILEECHETITSCFHAFFPTPTLKWNHICSLLYNVKDGKVPNCQSRELTASCAAMCTSRSLRDLLQYVVPLTQNSMTMNENRRPDTKMKIDTPVKSATVPRSSHQKPPPVPPRAHRESQHKALDKFETKAYTEWNLLDFLTRMLDIVMLPIKQQMMTRQCGQSHDHGEIKQYKRLSTFCCKLMARIVAELTDTAVNVRDDLDSCKSSKCLLTPSRFMSVNQARAWNTGNGSPDSICFTVNKPIVLVGIGVYGGLGTFDYQVELLQDVQQLRSSNEDSNPAYCWVCKEVFHGSFTASDAENDIVQLKFLRPITLKEDTRYAIKLCNHGGRTANGECGLPAVDGPDGTTFRFTSCSLSFNGTTIARGQIPSFIYHGASRTSTNNIAESNDSIFIALRGITLMVASTIMERCVDLFCTLRNELTAEDLRRNAAVLQSSPVILKLLPYMLANLEVLDDSKSVVQILEMIHKVLPHVAAMNLLIPKSLTAFREKPATTTGHYYTWVESDHPYKQATVTSIRVVFPPSVSWIVLEMDPRSITAQPEDTLIIYAEARDYKQHCHCTANSRIIRPPFKERLVEVTGDGTKTGEYDINNDLTYQKPCLNYSCSYVPITSKLANIASEWPQKAILVPANEVIFSLETVSDYLNEYNRINSDENYFGFRCLCVGYEQLPFPLEQHGLGMLEMELAYMGSACATRLLAPDLDIPLLAQSTITEVQNSALVGTSSVSGEAESLQGNCETILLSRGLEMSSPPTVHQVLDGQSLLRCVSTERQFLTDFVTGAESTAGGRLASWLAPTSRVEPTKCEIKPPTTAPRPCTKLSLPIIVRDQYGEPVSSPALHVEVLVQPVVDDGTLQKNNTEPEIVSMNIPEVLYQTTSRDQMRFHAITMMKAYQNYSFEELRYAYEMFGCDTTGTANVSNMGQIAPERLIVRPHSDGTYIAMWTPRAPGSYTLRCTIDEHTTAQELIVVVAEGLNENSLTLDRIQVNEGTSSPTPSTKLKRFIALYSAGLRVRASPSLQAEELGRVPRGANITFVEEVVNKDGTWVRLSSESTRTYTEGSASVGWCLQYHKELERMLLIPSEMRTQAAYTDTLAGYGDMQGELHDWTQEDDNDMELNDLASDDRKVFPFGIHCDSANESDSSMNSFIFGAEPSKRGRIVRDRASTSQSPKRMQLKSNGNGGADEWWTPEKHRPENACALEDEGHSSRLAQTGTQTSPETTTEECVIVGQLYTNVTPKEDKSSPKSLARERVERRSRPYRHTSPPPVPARVAIVHQPPRKQAVSPSQAECLRALFAALLWHEGIVHDAIACAAFLKFHPEMPKQGTEVVTRTASYDVAPQRPQRHSVEVSSAGQYLRINQSTLDSLTRSGEEASTSRARKNNTDITPPAITEDEALAHPAETSSEGKSTSVVNVLPPALRALVALWDTLSDAEELTPILNKYKKDMMAENNENDLNDGKSVRKKKLLPNSKTPYSVRCELCGGANVPPPLAAHMRHTHPGCRTLTNRGYDRAGAYKNTDQQPAAASAANAAATAPCGTLAQAYNLWYMYCEQCRDKTMKAVPNVKQPKTKTVGENSGEKVEGQCELDHHVMRENAIFLLDLAPMTNSESMGNSPWHDGTRIGGSPPTPPGSVWQPAPPFQCLGFFGPSSSTSSMQVGAAKYHSLGRPQPPAASAVGDPTIAGTSQSSRVHRSVSMGPAGGHDLATAARPPLNAAKSTQGHDATDALTSGGSSLLTQPSAALQRLVGCGDWSAGEGACSLSAFEPPRLDTQVLMGRPVLKFAIAKRDLHAYRQRMDAAIRINAVRQYAFEALNWIMRSVTQATCVHDVMWWFCSSLEKYSCFVPPAFVAKDGEDNAKAGENAEPARPPVATPSAAALCPGGRSARGARGALHAFLGSVSALAPNLSQVGAITLQAVRCWALHYSPHDREFLHRSQVFSVISKILSHSEDGAYEENALGNYYDGIENDIHKDGIVWTCPDVTGWCDINVSSRQGMAGALTDGTTETFWESGDEDRNKSKWIQISYPGGTPEDRPHLLCIHIDNSRDTMNKILLVSFLYSSSSSQLLHLQDVDVDPKSAEWLCYTLPRLSCGPLRIRCELRGPEAAVRVRQLRVLSSPVLAPVGIPPIPSQHLHPLIESETLRVFRLVTSQVFGKLLEWNRMGNEPAVEIAAGPEDVTADADDSDLREHIVGILFAGHKLTSLQTQVMSHIVTAIGTEAARTRDDWETALLCADAAERANEEAAPVSTIPQLPTQDNYCFEMLSLLLALSGSAAGRAHLSQKTELLADLLALLHTGSERVQRQVISLLRRMIAEIPPQKMLAAINYGNNMTTRVTLLDHLVCYLSKAITVQVKVKGSGGTNANAVVMGDSLAPVPPAHWFMRGNTTKKHADLVAKLLMDMTEGKINDVWKAETRSAFTNYAARLASIGESDRYPMRCIATPTMWLMLAALCVCEESHLELINTGGGTESVRDRPSTSEARPFCANHDDGETLAIIECRNCGPLCPECDRFLHLNRASRTHHRQICKEEESAIRIDIHEGCGRAKLFWLLLLVDRRTLKALAEFRGVGSGIGDGAAAGDTSANGAAGAGPPGLLGTCRFCGTQGNTGLLAIGNVCADQQCQEHGHTACNRVLSCGHICGGVRGERTCLPCLFACAPDPSAAPLRQDADDMCMICFTDPLQAAPAIQLKCGHVFHLHCCKNVLNNKWIGPRITFSFSQCPICKDDMDHCTLEELLAPTHRLKEEVRRKALMRLEYEGLSASANVRGHASNVGDPETYAMERYAYYVCHKCGKAYFGGLARCEAETNGWWEPSELVCGACSDIAGARSCPKHGADFLEYKCRYCCSVAVFFCFGSSHFCNSCHDDFQRITNIPRHLLPHCPAGPKGEQLPGSADECPLHVSHPPTGEEYALGCGVCGHTQAF